MITKLSRIENVGRFDSVICDRQFSQNNIVFGFNGSGKSTLSDIFYSLSKNDKDNLVLRRRTLASSEIEPKKEIHMEMSTDGGLCKFENETWSNRVENMYVYNNQYIQDYVFVSKEFSGEAIPISMSKEGTALMHKKIEQQKQQKEWLDKINALIKDMKTYFSEVKEIGGSTITIKGAKKRCQTIANFKLYNLSQKSEIKNEIKNCSRFYQEKNLIDECKNKYNEESIQISRVSIIDLDKLLSKIPRIYRKEFTQYMSQYVKKVQVKWVLNGYYNQRDKDYCPFCGQQIVDEEAITFFKELTVFSKQKSEDKAQEIINLSKKQVEVINRLNIEASIRYFNEIIEKLTSANLLLKQESASFMIGLEWTKKHNEILDKIAEKIYSKIENPYNTIGLETDEKKCLQLLNKIAVNTSKLGQLINTVSDRLTSKISKWENNSRLGALYEIAFGEKRLNVEEMIDNAKKVITGINSIEEIDMRLDDLYNDIKLREVNTYLKELNVNFSIIVEKKRYFIKIKDYVKQPYTKDTENIFCSEGEQRALAFAYFLSEIFDKEIMDKNKVIVIDDPISSLDLCRKSVIAYWTSLIMKEQLNQTFILSHDVTFLERILCYFDNKTDGFTMLEMKENGVLFDDLVLDEYLLTDEKVYEGFIKTAMRTHNEDDVILAMMSLRPYAYVKKVRDEDWYSVMGKSTYFSHTKYSHNGKIKFLEEAYSSNKLKLYIEQINSLTYSSFDANKLIQGFDFKGFEFKSIVDIYQRILMSSISEIRKKALLLRPLLEACLYQLVEKKKFDPDHISTAYNNAIRGTHGVYRDMCKKLKELYDLTKKFHHGADDGSTLGISWINPKEMEYFDKEVNKIIEYINDNNMIRAICA